MLRQWFFDQIDYIFFWCGLAYLLVAVACLRVTKEGKKVELPWIWFGTFGLLRGLHEWLHMLALSLPDPVVFKLVRIAVSTSSLLALFEFGRRGWKAQGGRAPGAWIVIALLGLGLVNWLAGLQDCKAACLHLFGATGALLSATVLWRAAVSRDAMGRVGLRTISIAMFAFALTICTMEPNAVIWPAASLNQAPLIIFNGLTDRLILALCAFACVAGLWLNERDTCLSSPSRDHYRFLGPWVLASALALLIIFGWVVTERRGRTVDADMREDVLHRVRDIAQAVNSDWVKALTFSADDKSAPAYLQICAQLTALGHFERLRSIYSMAERNGEIVYGPGNLDENDSLAFPPGTVCKNPKAELWRIFRNVQSVVVGPYTGENGTLVSAFSPVIDPRSGEVLLVIGVDFMAEQWKKATAEVRLEAILLTPVLSVILLCGLNLLEWRFRSSPRSQRWWFRDAEALFVAAFGVGITAIVALGVHDMESRRTQQVFQRFADGQAKIISSTFHEIRKDLACLAKFIEAEKLVHMQGFESFDSSLAVSSAVEAWEWVPVIPSAEKQNFEAQIRSQGSSDFNLFEENLSGERVPASGREEYYPVACVTPLRGNEPAVGFDLGSEPVRRLALEKAASTGLPAATAAITLVQETGQQQGMLAYHPVFKEAQRRPLGFSLCLLRLQSALDEALATGGGTNPNIRVRLLDITCGGEPKLLAQCNGWDADSASYKPFNRHEYKNVYPLFMLGRSWVIEAYPGPAFISAHRNYAGLASALCGLVVTLLVSVSVGFLSSRQTELEQQVFERTRELNESKQQVDIIFAGHAAAEPALRKARILLAEDNASNQKVALAILKKLGYRADVAANGVATLEALSRIPYDLVLMDCQMPDMDGLEATRRIRDTSSGVLDPGVPIIAMTANAMQGDRERCISAGMDDYLPKPVRPRELAEVLDRWLRSGHKQGDGRKGPLKDPVIYAPPRWPETTGNGDVPLRVETAPHSPGTTREEPFATLPANASDDAVFHESDLLERLMDDRELAHAVVAEFLKDIPVQIRKLKDFVSGGDAEGARRQAHTIKGAAANIGAPAMREAALELEQIAKAGSLAKGLDVLPRLETEFERLRQTLEQKGWS